MLLCYCWAQILYSGTPASLEKNPEVLRLFSLFLCPVSCYLCGFVHVLLKDQKKQDEKSRRKAKL